VICGPSGPDGVSFGGFSCEGFDEESGWVFWGEVGVQDRDGVPGIWTALAGEVFKNFQFGGWGGWSEGGWSEPGHGAGDSQVAEGAALEGRWGEFCSFDRTDVEKAQEATECDSE